MDDLGIDHCPHHPPPVPPGPWCRVCQRLGLTPFTDDPPPQADRPPAAARCICLGPDVTGYRDCPSCHGRVRQKEFACALRLGTGPDGAACPPVDCPPARACPGYQRGR